MSCCLSRNRLACRTLKRHCSPDTEVGAIRGLLVRSIMSHLESFQPCGRHQVGILLRPIWIRLWATSWRQYGQAMMLLLSHGRSQVTGSQREQDCTSPTELHTGGSPFLGLLACLPIMAQSVAPQKSTSPPSNSACLLGSGSSAIVRLFGPEHQTQSANAFVECRRTQNPVIQSTRSAAAGSMAQRCGPP